MWQTLRGSQVYGGRIISWQCNVRLSTFFYDLSACRRTGQCIEIIRVCRSRWRSQSPWDLACRRQDRWFTAGHLFLASILMRLIMYSKKPYNNLINQIFDSKISKIL
jgi:hypothetical protein